MSKFTPGPWKVGHVPTKKREVYIASATGENIVGAGFLDEKNAAIIAAAPIMLSALRMAWNSIDQVNHPAAEVIRSAIEQAEGT